MQGFLHTALIILFASVTIGAVSGKLCSVNVRDTVYDKMDFYSECVCRGSADSLVLKLDNKTLYDRGRDQTLDIDHPCHFKVNGNDDSGTNISIGCPMCWKDHHITVECYYAGHIDRGSGMVNIPSWSASYPCPGTSFTGMQTTTFNTSLVTQAQNDSAIQTAGVKSGEAASGSSPEQILAIVLSVLVAVLLLAAVLVAVMYFRYRKAKRIRGAKKPAEEDPMLKSKTDDVFSPEPAPASVFFYKQSRDKSPPVDKQTHDKPDTGYTTHPASSNSTLEQLSQ